MKLKMKRISTSLLSLVLLLVSSFSATAQPEMADGMRAEGKIYVVVAIIVVILLGVFAYLFILDRKLTNLEKRLRDRS
jgi:CcmD family protein